MAVAFRKYKTVLIKQKKCVLSLYLGGQTTFAKDAIILSKKILLTAKKNLLIYCIAFVLVL